jgi:magnesium-transporting ATPase (P-type)
LEVAAKPAGSINPAGLTTAEVEARRDAGQVNVQPDRTSRSYAGIVRANIFTRFNAIITVLASVVLAVGHPIDAIFAIVMVVNSVIGIVQEVRAKRTLDRLRVLITPAVTVVRDGQERRVDPETLVTDDIIRLASGDQVPVDGDVVEATGFDVDESALTGEADAIPKLSGDEVRSGSVVVGGSAVVRARAVGEQAWIYQLLTQAKEYVLATSELRNGVDRILRYVSWLIAPLAALLLWSQLRDEDDVGEGLVSAVAGVVGLVPQGLVLLVSMALAVAVIRLAGNHVIVQELHAVEGLARVDVLCLDKTGTLTTGAMTLDRVEAFGASERDVAEAVAALAAVEPTPSATLMAAAGDTPDPGWQVTSQVTFSSARKWSGASFELVGSWIVGAPEILLAAVRGTSVDAVMDRIESLAEDARRVLLVARSEQAVDDERLPDDLDPVALVVLAEEVRGDAAETMAYFAEQHVEVKIISGDNPVTVSAVAQRLGVAGADRFVDMRDIDLTGEDAVDELVASTTVFGRVLPQQKRELVEVLQRNGHTVAMTGDGVNDIPALKKADIGIGMDTATAATKAVSQLVLLDGRFDRLPAVVGEGRRVITNMERVSALFVTKTVYSAVFALVIGVWGATFPFLPRHMSLISEVTIGLPAFALSFRAADRPYRPGYLRRVMRFAIPAGLATAAVILIGYGLVRSPIADLSIDEARTATTLILLVVALWVLYLLMQPVDRFDAAVLGAMILLATLAVSTPPGRSFYAIDWPTRTDSLLIGVYSVAAIVVMSLGLRLLRRWR